MPLVYSTSQAAKVAGVSSSTVRNVTTGKQYAPQYAGLWSAGVNPGTGQPRQFTEGDIRLLAYIRQQTAQGVSHAGIAAQIAAGAMSGFDWSPPEEAPEPAPRTPQPEPSTALVVVREAAVQLAGAIYAQAAEENRRLQSALIDAERRAAVAESELAALKAQAARPWYKRLFGG